MSIDRLARALGRSAQIDEWVIHETRERRDVRTIATSPQTAMRASRHYDVTVWRDRRGERGEASIRLSDEDKADFDSQLRAAAERAFSNVGEQWKLPPPAAPARVSLEDASIRDSPTEAIARIEKPIANLDANGGPGVSLDRRLGKISVRSVEQRLRTSSGLDVGSNQTMASVDFQLASSAGPQVLSFSRSARRVQDLRVEEAIVAATNGSSIRLAAAKLEASAFDLVIASRAFQCSRSIDDWLRPLAVQADGERVRRGVARYRPGQHVATGGIDGSGDELSVESDGAIDYALESAGFGVLGGAVRRFKLVHRGVAAAVALNAKEAALADLEGNGGARNLHFARGQRSIDQLVTGNRPVLTVHEFDWLRVDSESGEIVAQIGLATDGKNRDGVSGGTLSFNLFDALARLRLSRELSTETLVPGPAWIGINNVFVG